ncbi:MAG TPA: nitroreductase family deazaflavin-dependent oxidoreductase [Pilimelia sp.]|nr:nitroreductase family deazaflavin-dependent oxidoreductase [Pilimelia sp.]
MSRYTGLVRRLGHTRWFPAVGRRLVPLDRLINRVSKGRWSAIGRHGLPGLLLTTVGRRSGEPRTSPLLYVRDADAYVVTGSNWGQQHQPAWTGNLLACPRATVIIDGTSIPVTAELVTGAERDRLWRLLRQVWPAYDTYLERAAGRDIRVFRLTPTGNDAG